MISRRDFLAVALTATAAQSAGVGARRMKGLEMAGPYQSRTISVTVNRNYREAYDFASMPENMHKWASGLSNRPLENAHGAWIAETPDGRMTVRFAERNEFGVLDHHVIPPSGDPIYVPVRVVANGSGCDVTLTVFRRPGVSEEEFDRDTDWVSRDLNRLKALLES